jgi:hypothetical protein
MTTPPIPTDLMHTHTQPSLLLQRFLTIILHISDRAIYDQHPYIWTLCSFVSLVDAESPLQDPGFSYSRGGNTRGRSQRLDRFLLDGIDSYLFFSFDDFYISGHKKTGTGLALTDIVSTIPLLVHVQQEEQAHMHGVELLLFYQPCIVGGCGSVASRRSRG